jgi:uncharacterized membrane protein YbhN (UPF0104 family)
LVSKRLRLGVSAGLFGYVAWRTDWGQVGQAFARLRVGLWLAAVGLYALTQVVSALRWQLLARPLGFRRPLGQLTGFYFIGMFFNLLLPTSVGGDVVRAWYLDGRSGRRSAAFLSVLVDRASGLLVLLSLACLGLLLYPGELPSRIHWSVWGTAGAAVAGLAALGVGYRFLGERYQAFRDLAVNLRPGALAVTTGLSVAVQAANVAVVWLVGEAVGAAVPAAYYWILVPMVTLLTLLPVSLNGMGVREEGTILFLAPLGVAEGTALAVAFLWFAVFTTASLCGGLVYLFGRFPQFEAEPEESSEHEPVRGDSDQGRAGQFNAAA